MINLIPPAAYRQIVREYWARVITVGLFLLGSAFAVALVTLIPSYYLISIQMHVVENVVSESTEKLATYDVSESELTVATERAQLLAGGGAVPFTEYQTTIERLAGSQVHVTSVSFTRGLSKLGTVSISGTAKNRQGLASFRDALEAEKDFIRVDLPISNLIKDQDIPFTIQIVTPTSTAITI